jgi:hypothetical protein
MDEFTIEELRYLRVLLNRHPNLTDPDDVRESVARKLDQVISNKRRSKKGVKVNA